MFIKTLEKNGDVFFRWINLAIILQTQYNEKKKDENK